MPFHFAGQLIDFHGFFAAAILPLRLAIATLG
jgi:hypothetical protein